MLKVLEDGFRSNQDYEDAGMPACVTLVNSLASAEIPRLNHFFNKMQKSDKNEGEIPIPQGQILVCKIFL